MAYHCTVRVDETPIDGNELLKDLMLDPAHGGLTTFFGIVRNRNHGRQVEAVSYDGYVPLAEKMLRDICEEAQQKWGAMRVYVVHRLGKLGVGETSVAIGVSTPHRDEAYEASRYVIEQLKVRLPVWKKEHYMNGETEWLRGHALCGHHKVDESLIAIRPVQPANPERRL